MAGFGLSFYIAAMGIIILNIEILSLFKGITPAGIITLNILEFLALLFVWVKMGKPLLVPDTKKLKNGLKKIFNSIKLDKGLLILGLGVLVLIFTAFILCAFLPVNDFDAIFYHAYRALVWAHDGYIYHFDASDVRNLVMPINSELIYTWIYSLTKKDFGLYFVSFFAYFFALAGIWTILGKFKISTRKKLWTIFIFSSFAGIISQISSLQTDLTVGTLILYSLVLFYDFVNTDDKHIEKQRLLKGYFSSLAFSIALGIKSTAFMAGLPVILIFFAYCFKKGALKKFGQFVFMAFVNFMIFSSYNYILNLIDYHNPFGSTISINRHSFFGGFKGFLANFITYNIQMLDFTGFTWGILLSESMFKFKDELFSLLNIPPEAGVLMRLEGLNSGSSEQTIGFGVVSILTFIPACILSIFLLIKGTIKKIKAKWLIMYAFGVLFYVNLIVLSFSIGYMVYSIRFITAFVTISAPILCLTYFKKNNIYKTLVVLFGIYYLFLVSGYLAARPFYNLLKAYRAEGNYANFIEKTRCMKYPFFKGDNNRCFVEGVIIPKIKDGSNVGTFSDDNLILYILKIKSMEKNINFDELIVSRFDNYDIKKYDYLITPYPSQPIDVFNKKDEAAHKKGLFPKDCYERKNDNNNKIVKLECGIPFKKIGDAGFKSVYNFKTEWEKFDKSRYSVQYIIWQNLK